MSVEFAARRLQWHVIIEDEAIKMGAQFTTKPAFQPYAVRDGNLITGQQQHSGGEVASLVISALKGDVK